MAGESSLWPSRTSAVRSVYIAAPAPVPCGSHSKAPRRAAACVTVVVPAVPVVLTSAVPDHTTLPDGSTTEDFTAYLPVRLVCARHMLAGLRRAQYYCLLTASRSQATQGCCALCCLPSLPALPRAVRHARQRHGCPFEPIELGNDRDLSVAGRGAAAGAGGWAVDRCAVDHRRHVYAQRRDVRRGSRRRNPYVPVDAAAFVEPTPQQCKSEPQAQLLQSRSSGG